MTPAHQTGLFAELVCSNSLKSQSPTSPAGQLKSEMDALGSVVLRCARENAVPAGEALGVDREKFASSVTRLLSNHENIEIVPEAFDPSYLADLENAVLCTGPLTSPELSEWLAACTGRAHLYFYDAVSPTVDAASLDRSIVFAQSRYDKGEGDDYLNCPFDRESYDAFVAALVSAERAPFHAFEAGGVRTAPTPAEGFAQGASSDRELLEAIKYFAGCTPIEAIAEKGPRSLAFGNFKPVGLTDPRTGRRPHAALQLRPENREKTLYSLVACQTRLKWGEQKRVFRMVPGLENAEFVRYGVIHRNTYLDAPNALSPELELRNKPGVFVSGQLTGVEGYVESAAMGILSGLIVSRRIEGDPIDLPPRETAYGSLLSHLQDDTPREFAPMNINWGLFPEPAAITRDKGVKRAMKLEAAQREFASWLAKL